jgi:uncharacterized protein (TIGR03118 family)
MNLPTFFLKSRAASDPLHPYRPVLEGLEDRCLLSGGFAQVNLASDVPGLARVTDSNLVNPWGIAYSPTGPFWFADNGSGASDLLDGRGRPVPLVVAIPSAAHPGGTPTGTVFNGSAGFAILENGVSAPSRFLFATEDGTISGWSALVDPTHALLAVDNSSSGADYKGLALAAEPGGETFLYAADFSHGTIDVFDQAFRPVVRPGAFQDPNLPDGYAPFNIQNINNLLFVTYAQQDEDGHEDVAGAGHGFIDVYAPDGSLVKRFASQGALDSPWGLALAPAHFGPFGGALLVGNNGDGRINAYDPRSGAFLGQLAHGNGTPITIPDLWALTFGNGHLGGDGQTLFFATGVAYDEHGLFGAIQAPGRGGTDTAGPGGFDPDAPGESGDYPLPPGGGPALRAGGADLPIPVSDLLPLRESSLVLVPTLSTVSQPGTRVEAPVPAAPFQGASVSGPVFMAVPAANSVLLTPAEGDSQPARGDPGGAVALSTFLDSNASANAPRRKAGGQGPGSDPRAAGTGSPALADYDAGNQGVLAEPYVEKPEAQASAEPGPEALPPSGRADGMAPEIPSETRPESAAGDKGGESRDGGRRTMLTNLLVVVGISVLWACWLRLSGLLGQRKRTHETGASGRAWAAASFKPPRRAAGSAADQPVSYRCRTAPDTLPRRSIVSNQL